MSGNSKDHVADRSKLSLPHSWSPSLGRRHDGSHKPPGGISIQMKASPLLQPVRKFSSPSLSKKTLPSHPSQKIRFRTKNESRETNSSFNITVRILRYLRYRSLWALERKWADILEWIADRFSKISRVASRLFRMTTGCVASSKPWIISDSVIAVSLIYQSIRGGIGLSLIPYFFPMQQTSVVRFLVACRADSQR